LKVKKAKDGTATVSDMLQSLLPGHDKGLGGLWAGWAGPGLDVRLWLETDLEISYGVVRSLEA
jgi:hypothetical protein